MILSDKMDMFQQELIEKTVADYQSFQHFQTLTQQTLKEFHDICLRNEIWYYMAYGSLLGAIRDNGQIPWDYDIDVWVPYEHAQRLVEALERELPKEYYFVTRINDPKARHNIMRITPVGYDSEVLHVDVFWLTGLHVDDAQREKIRREVDESTRAMQLKHCKKEHLGVAGRVSTMKYHLEKMRYAFYADEEADKLFRRIMHPCAGSDRLTDNFYVLEFRNAWFGQPRIMTMAGGQQVCIPQDPDAILTLRYGDYMGVPSMESREKEYRTALNRLRQLAVKK